MSNNSAIRSTADQITLPLGKALSILELFVMDLPLDEANAGYVVADLIREAEAVVARVFDDKTPYQANIADSDEPSAPGSALTSADVLDLSLTIAEVVRMLADASRLLGTLKSFIDPALIQIEQNEAHGPGLNGGAS